MSFPYPTDASLLPDDIERTQVTLGSDSRGPITRIAYRCPPNCFSAHFHAWAAINRGNPFAPQPLPFDHVAFAAVPSESATCAAAFEGWTQKRGVWPRLTHEEVFKAAWNEAVDAALNVLKTSRDVSAAATTIRKLRNPNPTAHAH